MRERVPGASLEPSQSLAPGGRSPAARRAAEPVADTRTNFELLNSPGALAGPHNLGFICFLLNVTYNSCRNVYLPNATFSAWVIYSSNLSARRKAGRLLLASGSIPKS